MHFLINTHHYSSVNANPNSWMMSTISCIPIVIMISIAKNLLSCLPKCPLTLVALSSATMTTPVNYSANPKPVTVFLTISSNHRLLGISAVSISFHTFKKFVTNIELLPSCTIITCLKDLYFPHSGQKQLIWIILVLTQTLVKW